ncbi:unnamed protein product [Schistosoma margrebowiei]|uniref:Uncharacterized protein n=1 Tax=Schistosoma margrebowiei TaxID=48269 RepID=A0A183LI88_9TREM|nr:unnamed protein product [Schistosoma margrebowiei]
MATRKANATSVEIAMRHITEIQIFSKLNGVEGF